MEIQSGRGQQVRENLKKARKAAGMTQQQVADKLGISTRAYQDIECGKYEGKIKHWDLLEDLFGIHQRILRKLFPMANEKIDRNTK